MHLRCSCFFFFSHMCLQDAWPHDLLGEIWACVCTLGVLTCSLGRVASLPQLAPASGSNSLASLTGPRSSRLQPHLPLSPLCLCPCTVAPGSLL